jgi:branched-subunit amino acid aminotransferase/4-amino-4-deoxychorismate lyase
MTAGGDFFQFQRGELRALDLALDDTLSVADSFLVSNGLVRGLARHVARFSKSIWDEQALRQLPAFLLEVVKLIPRTDHWFPRLEYRSSLPEGQRLFLRLRTAPERSETCTLWTSDEQDPRQSPRIKGPDLAYGQRLRRAANLHGADEAVITDANGFIADGALSSVVWWREGVLFGPDQSTNWLPSVTRDLVFEIAEQAGFETGETRARPEDLASSEVWTLSALQGIRGVTRWGELQLGPLALLSPFRKRLALLAQPLPAEEEVIELVS